MGVTKREWSRGHRTRFCGSSAESAHQMHFLRFLREDWDEFHNRMYVKAKKKKKSVFSEFSSRYHI